MICIRLSTDHCDHNRDFTTSSPANKYVGIDQSITYGLDNLPLVPLTSGIVDTGTSLILFTTGMVTLSVRPSYIQLITPHVDAYNRYVNATGATFDEDVGLLSLPADQFWNLQSLFFNINGVRISHLLVYSTFSQFLNSFQLQYEFTNDAQIWPRSVRPSPTLPVIRMR